MIDIQNVSKKRGDRLILDEINLKVTSGCLGLIGANGVGKTTLMKCMCDLVHHTGRVTLGGKAYREYSTPMMVTGTAFTDAIPANFKCVDYLRSLAIANGIDNTRLFEAIKDANIASFLKKKIGALSTGMKQRLSIACIMLVDPKYMILDEPTSGLDQDGIAWFRNYILRCKNNGKIILISSHILSEVEKLVDGFAFMKSGRIIAEKRNKSEIFVEVKADDKALAMLRKHFEEIKALDGGTRLNANLKEVNQFIQSNSLQIMQIYEKTISLEDYYHSILGISAK
jgi:ABC-2 type transport system ATP-binding protein